MFELDIDKEQGEGFEGDQVDSPKFASQNPKQERVPAFGESYSDDYPSFDQKQTPQVSEVTRLEKVRALESIDLKLTKLVCRIETMKSLHSLSLGFRQIFHQASSWQHQPPLKSTPQLIRLQLTRMIKSISNKHKLNKQSGLLSIISSSILIRNQSLNDRKLQAYDTRKHHESMLKQNEDRDNLNALEIQNTYLKKEILREEREQNSFVENMIEMLDKYDLPQIPQNSTHRPYLTSFGNSPEPFEERKKMTSKGGERKLRTKKH